MPANPSHNFRCQVVVWVRMVPVETRRSGATTVAVLTAVGLLLVAFPTLFFGPIVLMPSPICSSPTLEYFPAHCFYGFEWDSLEFLLFPMSFLLLASGFLYARKPRSSARWSLLAGAGLCLVIAVGGTLQGGAYFIWFALLEVAAAVAAVAATVVRRR